jgi:hypothetical protein
MKFYGGIFENKIIQKYVTSVTLNVIFLNTRHPQWYADTKYISLLSNVQPQRTHTPAVRDQATGFNSKNSYL